MAAGSGNFQRPFDMLLPHDFGIVQFKLTVLFKYGGYIRLLRIKAGKTRYVGFYGDERAFADGLIPSLRAKLSSLSEFVREIKVGFARYYNKKHNRRGYFWGDRFKSVIVDKGETLINCLAYIDLNPLRAGIVCRPEDYRWNSLGYHVQTYNRDNFLSTDFGLKEFNVKSKKSG